MTVDPVPATEPVFRETPVARPNAAGATPVVPADPGGADASEFGGAGVAYRRPEPLMLSGEDQPPPHVQEPHMVKRQIFRTDAADPASGGYIETAGG